MRREKPGLPPPRRTALDEHGDGAKEIERALVTREHENPHREQKR